MARITKENERLLSKLFEVGASGIHGKGIFAKIDIPKGAFLGKYEGPVVSKDFNGDYTYTYPLNCGRWVTVNGANDLRFLNHNGKNPNAAFPENNECFALKSIKKGAEVTINYNSPWSQALDRR